jgi:hypothetical protein
MPLVDFRHPAVNFDGEGWIIAWSMSGFSGPDADVFFARTSDDGATWTMPQTVERDADHDDARSDRSPTLTTDGHGFTLLGWEGFTITDSVVASDIHVARLPR